MEPEKTQAIVLRVVDFSETSCVVTLMTRSLGKITGLAKGARRPKGPFENALDLLAVCNVVLIHKKSEAMDLLTEAKLERRFRSSLTDLNRLYVGYYIAELLRLLTDEADPHPEIYDFAIKTLTRVDQGTSLSQAVIQFELFLLESLGHLPMLTRCVGCGRDKTTLGRVKFALNDGGVLCDACRPGKTNVVSLSGDAFELLLMLTRSDFSHRLAVKESQDRELVTNPPLLWDLVEPSTEPSVQTAADESDVSVGIAEKTVAEKVIAEIATPDAADEQVDPVVDLSEATGFVEVRELIKKYITHLVGHPPRLHAYLKNL